MKTEMEVKEIKNESIAFSIAQGLEMRAEAYKLEQQAKKLKEEANSILEPLLDTLGADKVTGFHGTVSLYTSTRSKFNLVGFKEELVRKSIPTDIIAEAEKNNTETTTSAPTVKFTPRKEKV